MTAPGPAGQPPPYPSGAAPDQPPAPDPAQSAGQLAAPAPAWAPAQGPPGELAAQAPGWAPAQGPPGELAIPAPPPGPGVLAPFPAPPTEGRTARLWWGLAAGGVAVVLCCGAGLTAVVGLALTGTEALNEQARVVVGGYLDAVRAKDYREAYGRLCERAQQEESADDFARRVQDQPPISSYQVGDVSLTELTVPVTVTYETGGAGSLRIVLEQDRGTGELEVCDVDR